MKLVASCRFNKCALDILTHFARAIGANGFSNGLKSYLFIEIILLLQR